MANEKKKEKLAKIDADQAAIREKEQGKIDARNEGMDKNARDAFEARFPKKIGRRR